VPRLRIALAQINSTVGDLEGNSAAILSLGTFSAYADPGAPSRAQACGRPGLPHLSPGGRALPWRVRDEQVRVEPAAGVDQMRPPVDRVVVEGLR